MEKQFICEIDEGIFENLVEYVIDSLNSIIESYRDVWEEIEIRSYYTDYEEDGNLVELVYQLYGYIKDTDEI